MLIEVLEVIIGDGSESLRKGSSTQYNVLSTVQYNENVYCDDIGNDDVDDDDSGDGDGDGNDDADTDLQVPQHLNVSNRTAHCCAPEHHLCFIIIVIVLKMMTVGAIVCN